MGVGFRKIYGVFFFGNGSWSLTVGGLCQQHTVAVEHWSQSVRSGQQNGKC